MTLGTRETRGDGTILFSTGRLGLTCSQCWPSVGVS